MEVLIAIVLVALVAVFVSVPLLRARAADGPDPGETELEDLESRKQAKYREIRDTELDHAAGKIDDDDFARQDAELRAEAVAILKRIDELGKRRARPGARDRPGAPPGPPAPPADGSL
jgi:hypothetical protein